MRNYKLNQLVAERILGLVIRDGNIVRNRTRSGIPPYSQDIKYAWLVVEELENKFSSVEIYIKNGMTNVIVTEHFSNGFLKDRYQGYEKHAPLAICKAALKAVGEVIE